MLGVSIGPNCEIRVHREGAVVSVGCFDKRYLSLTVVSRLPSGDSFKHVKLSQCS
jgi:hypothetical protein